MLDLTKCKFDYSIIKQKILAYVCMSVSFLFCSFMAHVDCKILHDDTWDFIEQYGFSLSTEIFSCFQLRKIDFHHVAAPFIRSMSNFDFRSESMGQRIFFYLFSEQ